jgi:hypothetical protein
MSVPDGRAAQSLSHRGDRRVAAYGAGRRNHICAQLRGDHAEARCIAGAHRPLRAVRRQRIVARRR